MNPPNVNSSVPQWLWDTPIAHCGLHGPPGVPENSLAAFAAAAEAGYAVEMDVRLLKSGEVVVFHDVDWKRVTGYDGIIEETAAAEITPFRILQTDEKIPLLTDVLQTVAGRVPLLVELKSGFASVGVLEDAVLQVLAGYNGPYALQVFRKEAVAYLVQNAPEGIACGQIGMNDKWHDALLAEGDGTSETTAHFLAYAAPLLPTPVTTAFREKGGPVLAWTLQNAAEEEQTAPYCDNIIFQFFTPTKGKS